MVKPSNSNADSCSGQQSDSSHGSTGSAQQGLRQGIAALEAKDYDTALAIFKHLEQISPVFRAKAQMGMVQVYQRQGNTPLAQQYCQDLLTSSSPEVRQWAQQVLKQLPLSSGSDLSAAPSPTPQAVIPEDQSGFVPLEPGPGMIQENPDPSTAASDMATGFTSVSDTPPSAEVEVSPDSPPAATSHQSLFHYQQLNQQTEAGVDRQLLPEPTVASHTQEPAFPQADSVRPMQQGPQQRQTRTSVSAKPAGLTAGKPYRLWAVQLLTAIAILGGIHWSLYYSLKFLNHAIRIIRWPIQLRGLAAFEQPHLGFVVAAGVLVTLVSPWVFDRWLTFAYQQRILSSRQLKERSPEALRLLRRICRQRDWQLPELRLLPDLAPLCFSYGWSPRTARIVISQGLLDGLSGDQLAALYAYELSHIANWDLPVASGLGGLLLMLHSGYWYLATWGEQKTQGWLRMIVGTIANLLYGMFWLLRKLGLWLSRMRGDYCDRTSLMLSRQPAHHQYLLLDLTRQIARDTNQRGHLHPLLTCLDSLMPLSPQQAMSPGSFLDQVGLPGLIAGDCLNPYRYWLTANNSHAMLGERLLFMEQWAQHWRQPSLGLTLQQLTAVNSAVAPSRLTLRDLGLQNSPLIGLIAGGGIALGLWFMGGVVNRLNWQQVSWLYQDSSILAGGLLIGLGMGILMRVNTLFPEPSHPRSHPYTSVLDPAITLFHRPPTLPVSGQPIALQGKLLGPSGLPNSLGQSLYLTQAEGMIQLRMTSPVGWWRGLNDQRRHPAGWIGRSVTVSGWQRRGGGLLWIEVASIKPSNLPPYQLRVPLWTTVLGIAAGLWGVWLILTGG